MVIIQEKTPETEKLPQTGISSPGLKELLHQRAKDKASPMRWNANILILVSINFISVVVLTLQGASGVIVAAVAVFGLLLVWLISWLHVRRVEQRFFQQEMQRYAEMTSDESSGIIIGETVTRRHEEMPLTHREREILVHMAMGKVNKEIATSLGISAMTVKNHISHILEKLQVNDRTSAVLLALRRGWIRLDEIQVSP